MSKYSHQTNANLIAEMQRIQTNIETLTVHIQQLNHRQSIVEVHVPSATSAPVLNLDGQDLVAFLREQREKHRHTLHHITAELHGRFESEYTNAPVVDEQTPPSIPTPDTSRNGKTGAAPNITKEPNDGWS